MDPTHTYITTTTYPSKDLSHISNIICFFQIHFFENVSLWAATSTSSFSHAALIPFQFQEMATQC